MFELTNQPIDPAALEEKFRDGACGALVVF
jgi:molybdopterin synthase catalytic subunit